MPREELAFVPVYQSYFDEPAGREHFRFLETLAAGQTDGAVVVDVGTLFGSSALALASNPRVTVWTYDICNHIPPDALIRQTPNIVFRIKNGIDAIPEFVGMTDLIVLDIDPHDGVQERAFFEGLLSHGYKGVVVCDDIHVNEAMETWWNSITLPKEDVTAQGHWSGTGIVHFN